MTWEFLDTGFGTGEFNMALDMLLAARMGERPGLPVLRFYGWSPPAISIGHNQSFDEFDVARLHASGIDIVRRPTGGRAILHADELTYAVVMHAPETPGRELYRFINRGLLAGVRSLGIDAVLSDRSDDFRTEYRTPEAIPCFATSARSEIHAGGRKLIGSAQRRFGDVILQHGSFLLGPRHASLTSFLANQGDARDGADARLKSKSIDAESLLGRVVPFEEAARQIRAGFETACGVTFVAHAPVAVDEVLQST
jgi:lipoate-protein ligase A